MLSRNTILHSLLPSAALLGLIAIFTIPIPMVAERRAERQAAAPVQTGPSLTLREVGGCTYVVAYDQFRSGGDIHGRVAIGLSITHHAACTNSAHSHTATP
jgi:hypothetical protein